MKNFPSGFLYEKKESEGFITCNCTKGGGSNFCPCRKMNMKCDSKCHNSEACRNKEEKILSLLLCFMNKWFQKMIEFIEKIILLQKFITFIYNHSRRNKNFFWWTLPRVPGKPDFAWNMRQSPMKTSFTWTLPDILEIFQAKLIWRKRSGQSRLCLKAGFAGNTYIHVCCG